MARVLSGSLGSQVTGSAGGLTFRAVRGSQVVQSRGSRTLSRSDRQVLMHARFLDAVQSWGSISDQLRLAWTVAARRLAETDPSGRYGHGSGFQLWVGCRCAAVEAGFPVPVAAPTGSPPRGCWFVHGTASVSGSTLFVEPQRGTAGGSRMVAYWSDILFGGRSSVERPQYFLWSASLSTGRVNRYAAWSSRFSPGSSLVSGASVAFRAHVVTADGLRSPSQYDLITFEP